MATDKPCCPCCPEFGLSWVSLAAPGVTENPLTNVAVSPPVETVTSRAPVAAIGSMFKTAVRLVEELTVMELTVTPVPKVAVVVP